MAQSKANFSYLRAFYNGTYGTFCAISKGVGLAGYQNILDRLFIAHIKNIAYI